MQRLLLTLASGGLLATGYVVSKVLMSRGFAAATVSLFQVGGAAAVLGGVLLLRGGRVPMAPSTLRYFAISALIAVLASNVLGNWVLARIPAGVFTLMVTLSPVFTSLFNAALDRRLPAPTVMAGTGLGMLGVALVQGPRVQAVGGEQALALVAALGVPVLLAAGNVYRSRHWPRGLGAPAAAAGTLLMQSIVLVPLFLGVRGAPRALEMGAGTTWALLALLVLVTVLANVAGSALQRAAGSVAFSQVGYVIAVTGVLAGAIVFGERLGVLFWPALMLVFTGVVLVNRAPATRAPSVPLQRGSSSQLA
nr:DMT family transporter [Myxococcus sp. RHSTA-1-4]